MRKLLLCFIAGIACINATAQVILREDFTTVAAPSLPAGWSNTFVADSGTTPQGWVTMTRSSDYFFGYSAAPRPQYAECNEYYHTGNNPGNLTSPAFSLAGVTTPYLMFDYLFVGSHYYSGGVGYFENFYIQISIDGGTTWTNIDTLPVGGYWDSRTLNLTAFAGNTNCKLNFRYSDGNGNLFGALLTNVLVFNPQANDIALTALTQMADSPNYVSITAGVAFSGRVTNLSPATINTFSVTYQAGAAALVTNVFTGVSIPSLGSYTFTCSTPYIPTIFDSIPVTIWVNETGDPNLTNDTMFTHVTGVTGFPAKIPVAEEATATWCDACPYGIIAFDDEYAAVYNNISLIAGHCSISTTDPMTDYSYGPWLQSIIPQYPYMLFDRIDSTTPDAVSSLYTQHCHDFAFAAVNITPSISGDSAIVPVHVIPATNMSGRYKLALILTEDQVHDTLTPSNWDQLNLYSGGAAGPMSNWEYNFDSLPNPVPATDMYYNHVERSITPGINGGSYLPRPLMPGTSYSYTFRVPIYPTFIHYNMHAIVVLIDSASGHILNSATNWLIPHPPLSISKVAEELNSLTIFPNPAKNSTIVKFDLGEARNVKIEVMDILGRVTYSKRIQAQEGNNFINLSMSDYSSGIYLVTLSSGNSRVTKQLMVNR